MASGCRGRRPDGGGVSAEGLVLALLREVALVHTGVSEPVVEAVDRGVMTIDVHAVSEDDALSREPPVHRMRAGARLHTAGSVNRARATTALLRHGNSCAIDDSSWPGMYRSIDSGRIRGYRRRLAGLAHPRAFGRAGARRCVMYSTM